MFFENYKKNKMIKLYIINTLINIFSNSYLLIAIIINISIPFSLSIHNHLTARLSNGNFLVISCTGKYIFDPTYTYSTSISGISHDNYRENLAHFSEEDNGYILFISPQHHHVLFSNGSLFSSISISISLYKMFYEYSVNHYNDSYYYYFIYYNINYNFIFQKYEFFSNNKSIQNIFEKSYEPNDSNYNIITCQLMKNNNINVITCFFGTYSNNNNNFINITVFDPENNFEIIQSEVTNTKNISYFII